MKKSPRLSGSLIFTASATLIVIAALAAQILAAQAWDFVTPLDTPSWRNSIIASVGFSQRNDQRRPHDLDRFQMNPRGVIEGSVLLGALQPGSFAIFQRIMQLTGGLQDPSMTPRQQYSRYFEQDLATNMAVLALARILDHEAMKRRLLPAVSEERVDYVMRSVLTQNAANTAQIRVRKAPSMTPDTCLPGPRIDQDYSRCRSVQERDAEGKWKFDLFPDEDVSTRSNAELYGWLVSRAGTKPFAIDIDWNYVEGGMASAHEQLRTSRRELSWPGMTLRYQKVPETWQQFRESIRQQLQPVYQKLRRKDVLDTLVRRSSSLLSWETMFSVTDEQIEQFYSMYRQSVFRVRNLRSTYFELKLSGSKASEFYARFTAKMNARSESLEPEFRADPSGTPDPAAEARLAERGRQLRLSAPREIFAQVREEFAADIASGAVEATIEDGSATKEIATDELRAELDRAGPSAATAPSGYRALMEEVPFNDRFASSSLLPFAHAIDDAGSIRVLVLKGLQELPPTEYPRESREANHIIRRRIAAKLRGKAYRKVAYELFQDNRVQVVTQTCSRRDHLDWPCIYPDARKWAEALFPERLFPGMVLPSDRRVTPPSVPGQAVGAPIPHPISSTLTEDQYFDRVMEISMSQLPKILNAPNNYVEPPTR